MKNICEKNEVDLSAHESQIDDARRDFLRKSLYVAYGTPVIMSLLAEKANAATSWGQPNNPPVPSPYKP